MTDRGEFHGVPEESIDDVLKIIGSVRDLIENERARVIADVAAWLRKRPMLPPAVLAQQLESGEWRNGR